MSRDLSPLLEFWGLKEEELNGEVFLSASSVFTRRRRLAATLPYSEFATSTSKAEPYLTTDYHERTLHDQEQVEEDFQKKSTRVTVPHASEEAGKTEEEESCGYDTNTTMESTSAVGIVCVNCAHCNVGRVNWCLECGTAVTGANSQPLLHSSSHSQGQTPQNPKSAHQLDIMPTEFHSGVKSCPQLSAKQFASNLDVLREVSSVQTCTSERRLVRTDSTHSRRKLVFSVKSPGGQYTGQIQTSNVRCWNTSGLYMWRKPSSLKSVQSSPCGKSTLADPGYQTNSCDSLYNKSGTVMLTSTSPFLLCLPIELLLHILSYLSQSELATSMLVCHRIYMVASDPSLWNCVRISHKKNVKDDSFLKISGKKPNCLVLAHCSGSISSACLQQIFCRMDTLQELTIDTCNFGPFTGDQLLISASIHCSQLSSVDIRWTKLSNKAFSIFLDNCHSLKKISVESVPQISMNTFFLLMKKQRLRLTHVRIQGNMSFSVQDLMTKCMSEGIVCPYVTSFSS